MVRRREKPCGVYLSPAFRTSAAVLPAVMAVKLPVPKASAGAALAAGDGKALEVLYDRMGRAILSVAYAVTGNLHDAEDVLSDTLVDAAVGAKGYRCGTGACAAVVAAVENGYCQKGEPICVRLNGGELTIVYTDDTVTMTGGAVTVFEGTIEE